jgi:hypothetical protein
MLVTQTQSYLCGSAPVQKILSELPEVRGERSQCGLARDRSEEARQCYSEGLHLGMDDVLAPALVAKHVFQSPLSLPERSMRLLSLAIHVMRAISWRKRHFIFTDEVSRCPRPHDGVKLAYKARPKGLAYAPAWRRSSQSPPPQRWQQIGSSSGRSAGVKRETTEKVVNKSGSQEQLAMLVKAAKWPDWSSSSQPSLPKLRNILLPLRRPDPGPQTPSQSA